MDFTETARKHISTPTINFFDVLYIVLHCLTLIVGANFSIQLTFFNNELSTIKEQVGNKVQKDAVNTRYPATNLLSDMEVPLLTNHSLFIVSLTTIQTSNCSCGKYISKIQSNLFRTSCTWFNGSGKVVEVG